MREVLGDRVTAYAEELGISFRDTIRYAALSEQIKVARLGRDLSIKEAAAEIKAPQYRIRAIESGHFSEMRSEFLNRYLAFLGLESEAREWANRHPHLAERIGLDTSSTKEHPS